MQNDQYHENTIRTWPDQARLVTSTGEQIDMPDMLNSDHIGGESKGGVTKEGDVVWKLKNHNSSDIKWVRMGRRTPGQFE